MEGTGFKVREPKKRGVSRVFCDELLGKGPYRVKVQYKSQKERGGAGHTVDIGCEGADACYALYKHIFSKWGIPQSDIYWGMCGGVAIPHPLDLTTVPTQCVENKVFESRFPSGAVWGNLHTDHVRATWDYEIDYFERGLVRMSSTTY